MNIPSLFASVFTGRRHFSKAPKRSPIVNRKAPLQLELLENRFAPASFTVLDSFSGASTSDATADSGGTADLDTAGIFVNSSRASDSGSDADLRSTPQEGSGDANQLADLRDVFLTYTGAAAGETGEVRAQTAGGALSFASGTSNSATMVIDYGDLSVLAETGNNVVLDGTGEICVVFASVEAGADPSFPVTATVNGVDLGPVDVFDSAGITTACFDASAFVGLQITSLVFTFAGNLATDFDIDQIEAPFLELEPCIDVEKLVNDLPDTELDCPIVDEGSTVTYTYFVSNCGNVPLSNIQLTDDPDPDSGEPTPVLGMDGVHNIGDVNNDDILDLTEIWEFTATSTAVVGEHDNEATATGEDELGTQVMDTDLGCYNVPADPCIELDKRVNDIPNTEEDCPEVEVGSTVNYTYFVSNCGNVPLSNINLTDDPDPDSGEPDPVLGMDGVHNIGDVNNDDILDLTEVWEFTATSTAAVGQHDNLATVTGEFEGQEVEDTDPGCYVGEEVEEVTRTQGFWQTHTEFTSSIFNDLLGGNITIGSPGDDFYVEITSVEELFGGFYASIPKLTTNAKRSGEGQARMILLQQLLAAELNCAAFGCSMATQDLIADAKAAFADGSSTKSELIDLAGQLDDYNNSGDDGDIPDSLGSPGRATPRTSQSLADKAFWDFVV